MDSNQNKTAGYTFTISMTKVRVENLQLAAAEIAGELHMHIFSECKHCRVAYACFFLSVNAAALHIALYMLYYLPDRDVSID